MEKLAKQLIIVISLLFANIVFADCIDDNCKKKSEIELPTALDYTTPGFDFICYNSCKDRNDEKFCLKQCTLAIE